MTLSPYLASIRAKIGHDLLVLPAVAVVVRDAAGRLLLVRDRTSGTWSLPAGAIELGEPPSEAAHRELHEETGLADVRLELIAALGGERFRHTYPNGDEVEYSIFVYQGSASESSILKPKDRNEIEQARFFEREAVPEIGLPYPAEAPASARSAGAVLLSCWPRSHALFAESEMNVRHILVLAISILTVGTTACGGGEGDTPAPAYDVETARTEVLAAEMAMNEAVDGLDCATGVSMMGEADPIFVSGGNVVRTRAELAGICEQMVAPRSGAVFSIESRAAHVVADDAAFVVREGPYTISYLDGTSQEVYLVMTSIWARETEGWKMVHLHESVRSPEIAEVLSPGGG